MRELAGDPRGCLWIPALATEVRRRPDLHLTAVAPRDAHGRIAATIAGVYEGPRRRELISCPPSTGRRPNHLGIAMAHVGRTLRRMHEERLVLVDHQVVPLTLMSALRHLRHTGI